MAGQKPYEIASEKVDLSMNWGLSALDYVYTDYDRATARFNTMNVDFQTLMICVGARRAAVVENEIRPMSSRMRTRNNYLSDLSGILAALTTVQSSFSGDESLHTKGISVNTARAISTTYSNIFSTTMMGDV